MEKEMCITTTDNPYDPFDQWDEWYFYDVSQGYNTCERLARIANTSTELSDEVNSNLLEEAIDELVDTGIAVSKTGKIVGLRKVTKD